jgi:glycosyltransferase involved in cell wall biosynthesis
MPTTDMSTRKLVLFIFVGYYLPGYRSGGPVRTIANFVDHLGDEFEIRIVCRDRDALDTSPYPDVAVDAWNAVGKAQVFYASSRTMNLAGVARLLRETPHDVLYLNSFFAFAFTGLPLLARRLGMAPRKPCVIAPRGEFSAGAISLKAAKKRVYLAASKAVGLYDGLHWQASSAFEAEDIRREFGAKAKVIDVAPNLPPKLGETAQPENAPTTRAPGPLRIVFLSRISPKKNLDYLLRVLKGVTEPVALAIYGPLREPDYWQRCMNLIDELPAHISVDYRGEVNPIDVTATFAQYDLFALPTRGENFGHVILESLIAGTPVLLSDQTPWQDSGAGALNVLPLNDERHWQQAIDQFAKLSYSALAEKRQAALAFAKDYLSGDKVIQQNRALFLNAAQ